MDHLESRWRPEDFSNTGCHYICSLILPIVAIAICFYALGQFLNLVTYGSNTIMVSSRDSFFDTEFEFQTDDGLMIAFGLATYDENYKETEDPTYG